MPPDLIDLKRRFASKAELDDRPIPGKVAPRRRFPGAVKAGGIAALVTNLEGVFCLLVVNGFSAEHMPLSIDQHPAFFKVHVAQRADDVKAEYLLLFRRDSKRLGPPASG
jgi:hypothetical protein